jgi:hypothetical protein
MSFSYKDRRVLPLPPVSRPAPEPLVSGKPRKPPRVSAKVKEAILFLIGMEHPRLEDAAKAAGITTYALRQQLQFPHVVAFLREERRARIEAACASNPEALLKLRDSTENTMAAVQAAKALEAMRAEETQAGGSGITGRQVPGVVIIVTDSNPNPAVEPSGVNPVVTIEQQPQPAEREPRILPIPVEPERPSGPGPVERSIYGAPDIG